MLLSITLAIALASFYQSEVEGRDACLYTGTNYTGTRRCYGSGNTDIWLSDYGYNDKFNSLELTSTERVVLYQDDSFHGQARVALQSIPDLGSIGLANKVSSFIVSGVVCFYTEENYGGDEHCYDGYDNIYRTNIALNDKFRSVKVPAGLQVAVFQHADYNGYGTLVKGDTPRLSSVGMDKEISSLAVTSCSMKTNRV